MFGYYDIMFVVIWDFFELQET